ncbi:response regulator transcription factor [Oligoflexia bacterium]|nr:response regulator transcription factor [Oligoflexia bacterium]
MQLSCRFGRPSELSGLSAFLTNFCEKTLKYFYEIVVIPVRGTRSYVRHWALAWCRGLAIKKLKCGDEEIMINLIIADDHVVLREALCELLETRGKYSILGQASNGEELLELLKTKRPDLVILDVSMPRLDGVEALQQMSASDHCPPVLILSASEGESKVRSALKAGAKGYLPKNVRLDELEFAIDSILQGRTYLSPSVTGPLMDGGSEESPLGNPLSVLTKREIEILEHLAEGLPNREIGKLLHISTRTVDTHRSNILKKLKVRTNAELVKIAIANGVIEI